METPKTTPTPVQTPGTWILDLYIVGITVVGRVHQLPGPDEEKIPGQVRKQGLWQATGMDTAWEDTDFGQYSDWRLARKVIEEWHRGRTAKKVEAEKAKLPCTSHAQFRPGCVRCERANQ